MQSNASLPTQGPSPFMVTSQITSSAQGSGYVHFLEPWRRAVSTARRSSSEPEGWREAEVKITTILSERVFKWCVWVFTFWVFVEVCDIHTLVWANSLGADAVTYCVLVNVDNTEGSTCSLLPEDYITVHLEQENVIFSSNKQENSRIQDASFIKYEASHSNSAIKQSSSSSSFVLIW